MCQPPIEHVLHDITMLAWCFNDYIYGHHFILDEIRRHAVRCCPCNGHPRVEIQILLRWEWGWCVSCIRAQQAQWSAHSLDPGAGFQSTYGLGGACASIGVHGLQGKGLHVESHWGLWCRSALGSLGPVTLQYHRSMQIVLYAPWSAECLVLGHCCGVLCIWTSPNGDIQNSVFKMGSDWACEMSSVFTLLSVTACGLWRLQQNVSVHKHEKA